MADGERSREIFEYILKQSPVVVLLAVAFYWVAFEAFPVMIRQHETEIERLSRDHERLSENLVELTAVMHEHNQIMARLVAELSKR